MKIRTENEQETIELGYKLGLLLKPNTLICMKGDLASGKTTITKGIGKALGVKRVINSPTFTILKVYEDGNMPLYHIDAYRLDGNDYDLGFSELLEDDGVIVVEWFEYLENIISNEYLELSFTNLSETEREIEFIAHGDKYEELLKELA